MSNLSQQTQFLLLSRGQGLPLEQLEHWWPELRPRRIALVGPCGSGKTTLGRAIAGILDCPAVDIDDLYWLPGWQGREESDFLARLGEAVSGEAWTLAGNYQRTQAMTWPRAELVIWLDFSLGLSLRRVLRRCVQRALRREIVCNGNRESLGKTFFSRESLLWWVIKVHRRHRVGYRARLGGSPPILRLRGPADVDRLMEQLWLLERPASKAIQPEFADQA